MRYKKFLIVAISLLSILMADEVVVENIDKKVIEEIAIENSIKKDNTIYKHNKAKLIHYSKKICINYPMTVTHFAKLLKIKQGLRCEVSGDGNIPPQKGRCIESIWELAKYVNTNPEADIKLDAFMQGNRCYLHVMSK